VAALRVGLQLYTLRDSMQEDVSRTLAMVAEIGYQEVEFAGYFGLSPTQIRTLLDDNGLTAPSAHVPLEALRGGIDPILENADTMGHRYLVLPYLVESDRSTLDAYRALADDMNTWGEACRAAGVQFAYHNHDFEFETLDGGVPYDVLLERCDADLVKMELDLFWIRAGGYDALDYFERHPDRFHLCHVKDMTASGEMTSVGRGVIDFATIFARAEQAGLRHYFVEHDNPPDPSRSVEASYGYLDTLTF
jgi:sugar phosphate isomerase/epimerase